MTTTLSRLQACGVPGLPTADYFSLQFAAYARGRLFSPLSVGIPPDDKLNANLAECRAWELNAPDSDNNEDGVAGVALQLVALRLLHGLSTDWSLLDRWVAKIEARQLKQHVGESVNVGGWAQWWSPVRKELLLVKDTLENHVSYDDATCMEIVQGLVVAALACEVAPTNHTFTRYTRDLALESFENAILRAIADAERNNGLGNFHHVRTHSILDARAHEPGVVSTDATASLQYMLCLAWAVTRQDIYRKMAVDWTRKLEAMRANDGKFYPFVRQRWTAFGMKWEPVGFSPDYKIVTASQAFSGNYEKNADGTLKRVDGELVPIIGLPPTIAPQQLIERSAAARKG